MVEAGQRRRRTPPAGIGLRAERQDGGTGLVAKGQRSGPASTVGQERIADRGAAGEPADWAEEFTGAPDAHGVDARPPRPAPACSSAVVTPCRSDGTR